MSDWEDWKDPDVIEIPQDPELTFRAGIRAGCMANLRILEDYNYYSGSREHPGMLVAPSIEDCFYITGSVNFTVTERLAKQAIEARRWLKEQGIQL